MICTSINQQNQVYSRLSSSLNRNLKFTKHYIELHLNKKSKSYHYNKFNKKMEEFTTQDHKQRKYKKVSYTAKASLLQKVIFQGKSIKQAARETDVNYSTAKTILTLYRRKIRNQPSRKISSPQTSASITIKKQNENCCFKLLNYAQKMNHPILLVSSIGGKAKRGDIRAHFRLADESDDRNMEIISNISSN